MSKDRTCPLCGSTYTIYCSPISQDTVTMPFRDQSCVSGSCGLPCRVWDQVEQLQAHNARLGKMLELVMKGKIGVLEVESAPRMEYAVQERIKQLKVEIKERKAEIKEWEQALK